MSGQQHDGVRLAELVAALSLGIDLGFGQPMEHVLRQCLIAVRIAEARGLTDEDRAGTYWTALLVNVGCHTDAHEQAKWFGDDIALKADKYAYELRSLRGAVAGVRRIGAGQAPLHRFRIGLEFAISGHRDVDGMIAQHAAMARSLAEQLRLVERRARRARAPPTSSGTARGGRVRCAEPRCRSPPGSPSWPSSSRWPTAPAAPRGCESWPGPGAVSSSTPSCRHSCSSTATNSSAASTASRPGRRWSRPSRGLPTCCAADELDAALLAIADFVDLKSPYTLGHARALSELVVDAAAVLGLPATTCTLLGRAALVSGFGRLGVSNAIWDKPGPLGAGEWERVRLHPYFSERMLQQSDALSPLGDLAVQLRERLDGGGYPRGLTAAALTMPARLLAAADVYQAMVEPRPHRPARSPDSAAAELRREVLAGRLDAAAVDAVLTAAGHRVPRRREGPAGLTAREIEVLRLLARGLSNKQIAHVLVIAPKTAGNHVEHIYTKIGATNRAGASLFAVQHGLVPEREGWGESLMEGAAPGS